MSTSTGMEWDRRVSEAHAALDDMAAVVQIALLGNRVTATSEPVAEVIAGGEALRSARRVGFVSGSFNPLTKAHAVLGEAALRSGGVDVVVWTCAAASIDKEGVTRATLADRLVQMRSFARHEARSAVVLVNRGLYVDQARLVRSLTNERCDVAVVVGFDKAVQIFDSRYYDDRDAALSSLFGVARLLVAPRAGDDEGSLRTLLSQRENVKYADRVAYLDVPSELRKESSTAARRLAANLGDEARSEALRELVEPEGFALCGMDGPYVRDVAESMDAYLWRSKWVERLTRLEMLPQITPLSLGGLVVAAVRQDAVGAEIRALLGKDGGEESPVALVRALELVREA